MSYYGFSPSSARASSHSVAVPVVIRLRCQHLTSSRAFLHTTLSGGVPAREQHRLIGLPLMTVMSSGPFVTEAAWVEKVQDDVDFFLKNLASGLLGEVGSE